ncbi:recombinase RecT [Clostridium pasteurianum]|uniref:Recombinational DNA repair protein (RecE pathway) n=1 Tax=Clostridium pasteurianum BC1 TaxID=86416 RepID=R4KCN1_CLOPA|nr:RecT family recombinase [Clostridium pasteurianum]AGK97375.1 recombinational DNA repair protein (RecE pathway) [Clostridium pasteurianum BC1]
MPNSVQNTNNKALTTQEKNITEEVLSRVNDLSKKGELVVPQGYSAANALKSAWLMLQETVDREKNPVLQVCSKATVANSLLDMVIQGLSPAKKQCYFVAYGKQLQLMRSYMGTVAVTKRLKGIKDVKAYCIYEGDEFEQTFDLDTATLKITKFDPKFENIDLTKIKGAFAVVLGDKGPIYTEVMNINQIKKAWGQGVAYKSGKSTAHNNFTDEMAKKTVINRACKMFANTSDDSDLLIEAFNNSDEKQYDEDKIINNVQAEVNQEIEEKANKKTLDIQEDNVKEKVIDVESKKAEVSNENENAQQSAKQTEIGLEF